MAKRNLKNLHLRAIAAVDRPCQEHAKALVIKRAFSAEDPQQLAVAEIAKYICTDDGAVSFQTVLADSKFDQNVWPCVDALSQSIRSIVGDSSLTGGERDAQITEGVQQFLQSVRDISPEVSKQLSGLLVRKREGSMPKTVEELQSDVTKLEGQVTDLTTKLTAAEKAKTDAMNAKDEADAECKTAKAALDAVKAEGGELATVKAELATAKAALTAATEETLKVGDVEVKKSEVGEAQFKLTKGLQDEAAIARLEKRASEEFPNLVGTSAEKAQVLKLVSSMPEDAPARKSLEAILKSAEKMIAQGFARLGAGGGQSPTQKAAEQTFKGKVAEIRKRDNISEHAAMTKARSEFPSEFAAAYPDSAPAEQAAN
jgi:capsule polysaccharide export protein KpsE/RkpR